MEHTVLKTTPAVFAVANTYQIMVPVKCETLMWVRVGDRCFYDHANGTLRSATDIHRMTVPQELLDAECSYDICYRVITQRKAYRTESEDEVQVHFEFHPVVGAQSKAFLIADAHNVVTATVAAAKQFEAKYGALDFLILAGDVPEDSGDLANFDTIYQIIGQVTGGQKPVVYAKGNHDLRGVCAEKMDEYSPIYRGNSYFSFKIGDIWGLSLDCGEDKNDDHVEYGHTVCCHEFRLAQTEFIKEIIDRADSEYKAKGIRHKIIVSHNPFSEQLKPPFNIEEDIYREWCTLLREHVQPELMLSGHMHWLAVNQVGGKKDHLGQPCPVLIGTKPFKDKENGHHFVGTGLFFRDDGIKHVFIDDFGNQYEICEG